MQNFFLTYADWTHPTISFLILLLLPYLFLSSISTAFDVTTDSTKLFILPFSPSLLSLIGGCTYDLMPVLWWGEGSNQQTRYWVFLCNFFTKTRYKKTAWFKKNYISEIWIMWLLEPYIYFWIRNNTIYHNSKLLIFMYKDRTTSLMVYKIMVSSLNMFSLRCLLSKKIITEPQALVDFWTPRLWWWVILMLKFVIN